MSMVSVATVISFESVGAVLVVALLVAPPATAYLISQKLKPMILLAALFGLSGSLLGYLISARFDTSIAGGIATMLGVQFAVILAITQFNRTS